LQPENSILLMITKTFIFGKEKLEKWIDKNCDVEKIIFTGTVDPKDVDNCDSHRLHYDDFFLNNNVKNVQFSEISFKDNFNKKWEGNDYLRAFSETPVSAFAKMLFQSDRFKSFVIENGCVMSENRKALIHNPMTEHYIHPKGVEIIGNYACFGYSDMKRITFNDSLVEIGKYAFANCDDVSELVIPDSVTKLGDGAFFGVDLEKLKISNNLALIPFECFKFNKLDNIEIPPSVKSIESDAFIGFIGELYIPEGVEKICSCIVYFLNYIYLPSTLKHIEPDFYFDYICDNGEHSPYVDVHPNNPVYYSKNGNLYFRENDKLVLPYKTTIKSFTMSKAVE